MREALCAVRNQLRDHKDNNLFWKEHKHELASVFSVLYREVEIEKVSLGDSFPIKGPSIKRNYFKDCPCLFVALEEND